MRFLDLLTGISPREQNGLVEDFTHSYLIIAARVFIKIYNSVLKVHLSISLLFLFHNVPSNS